MWLRRARATDALQLEALVREHAAYERADPPPPDLSDALARALAAERVLA